MLENLTFKPVLWTFAYHDLRRHDVVSPTNIHLSIFIELRYVQAYPVS